MLVWRICKAVYASTSFSGEGGRKIPSRWNHRGYRIVYTAQSLSLAQLETWVHADSVEPLSSYVKVCAEIPDDLEVLDIDEAVLPSDWRTADPCVPLQDIGSNWLMSLRSAVARVPATLTAGEFTYLLNPEHAEFARIKAWMPEPFAFDHRMLKTATARVLT